MRYDVCLCHLFLRLIRALRAVSGHPEGEGHVSIACVQCERLPKVSTLFALALPAECVPDPKNTSVPRSEDGSRSRVRFLLL